jgi:hypothetical protein
MPPIILNALPKIAFSKNPLWIKLQSDDFVAVVPATSKNYLEFVGPVVIDEVKNLQWVVGAATMAAKAAPDDSGLQFPAGAGDWPYVQSILPSFQSNFFLDKDFIITADNSAANPRLIFTAKTKSENFDFSVVDRVGVITHGAGDTPKANFRHHLQLWIANAAGTGYELAFTANIPLDVPTAGLTSVDIHEALHSFFYLDFDTPSLTALVKRCMASIRPWYFKYAQFYGVQPSVKRVYQSDTFIINKGGLGMQASLVRDIYSELQINPADRSTWRFLRQGSKNKLIRKEQPDWLTWLNLTDEILQVQLEIVIYNTDATSATFTTSGSFAVEPGQKYQFQCGYTQLGIAGRQAIGKTPIYYTARLKGAAGYLSAEYAFVIDYNYEEWPRCFVYENSLGAYQTIFTTGKGQSEFDRSKDDAQLAVDKRTAALTGDSLETNIFFQDKYTVNYGYGRANKRNLELLRDFFASNSIYLYDQGKLIPIGISTKNAKDAPDGINVYAGSFEYYPKYTEEVYTEEPNQVDPTIPELLIEAGSAVPVVDPIPEDPIELVNGTIIFEFGDTHLSIVGDKQRVSAPYWLTNRTNYRIKATQLGPEGFLRTSDVAYNYAGGYFDIIIPGWRLEPGDQLIIFPFVLNPDSL